MEENAHLKHEMPTSTPGKMDKYQFSFLITSSLSSPQLKVILDSLHQKMYKATSKKLCSLQSSFFFPSACLTGFPGCLRWGFHCFDKTL